MPYFRVHDSHKLVLTNFKVMFTSFTETSNFNKIKRYKAYLLLKQHRTQVHFTVRDPYQKAISLYKDKFQYTPLNADLTKPVKWEKPQRIFFSVMGLSTKRHSDQKIQETLINTPFDEFVKLLKKCYWLDEHTQPQNWILHHPRYLLFRKLGVTPERLAIYKMDQAAELNAFAESTGFDNSKHANSTAEITTPKTLSAQSIDTINTIYQTDFADYGYQMR
jgi:hypothetical protein